MEVERLLKQALKSAENAYRKSQQLLEQGHNQDIVHSKRTLVDGVRLLIELDVICRTQYEHTHLRETTFGHVRKKIG